MLLLSPKAWRLIDAAINDLPAAEQRDARASWTMANPAGPTAAIALAALSRKAARLQGRLNLPSLDDNEISDLENDLTFIDSVTAVLREAAPLPAA